MKIYLDIDDTLLNTDMYNMRPANRLKEFLEHMLRNHDVYWLATHCDGDAARAVLWLGKYVSPEIVDLIMRIKPTSWKVSKTEAIDFSEDFLWFDDILTLEGERKLKEEKKLHCFIKVDLDSNPDILKEFLDQPISCRGYVVDLFKKSYMLHIWTRPKISIAWHRKIDGPNKNIFAVRKY